MCGIVGFVGKTNCLPIVYNGLETLEYRGYDSAGIAYIYNNKINIIKEKGKLINLKDKLDFNISSKIAIGHTRWATHGNANKTNAHPHQVGKFTVVHNGIIENYIDLKNKLLKKGYQFKSDTDTEVISALLDYNYKLEKDILKTIDKTKKELIGSFALGILCSDDIKNIYTLRYSSPLILASFTNGNFLASDIPAILNYTNKYIILKDLEIAKINSEAITIYNKDLKEVKYSYHTYNGEKSNVQKNGYEHFMLKEINEEDKVFKNTINSYFDGTLKSLNENFGFLKKYKKIDIVACGSAYHTGVIAKSLIENYANIIVHTEVASEYRYKKCFYDKDTLVILVSQSGETADTLAALRKAKNDKIKTMAIVNAIDSSIAREADYVLYTKAGPEIAVATTKAYLAQLTVFSLITLYLAYINNQLSSKEIDNIIKDIIKLPRLIKKEINNYQIYYNIADKIYENKQVFFIGRGLDYANSLEGALKLKEISYINSVAYQAGELKHGTISLIENKTPVIAIATDEAIIDKTISNIKEVKARNAYVIYIVNWCAEAVSGI